MLYKESNCKEIWILIALFKCFHFHDVFKDTLLDIQSNLMDYMNTLRHNLTLRRNSTTEMQQKLHDIGDTEYR